MNLKLTTQVAFTNILDSKLRSGLTILGLIIGIAAVIILVGIGKGAVSSVNDQVSSLGADVITVNISSSDEELSADDVSAMKELTDVSSVTPFEQLSGDVSQDGDSLTSGTLLGVGAEYLDMMSYEISKGRPLSKIDVDNCTKVVVIGSDVATEFWGRLNPVGDTIKINGDNYTVIGLLESTGSSMGSNMDSSVIMPYTTAKYLGTGTGISSLYVRASDEDHVEAATQELERYLSTDLGISSDYFDVSSQESMLEAMENINNTLSLLLGGIAGISLLVGGIGVMNVMLVSVSERTREIGIRKSLGAKRRDILIQFLMEAMVLSIIGGVLGIAAGLIGGGIATLIGATFSPGIGTIVLAFGVSVAVGLIFGIAPSYRAAGLKPVDALRYE